MWSVKVILFLGLFGQTPCESRASMLEARLAAIRVEVQTCRARLDAVEPELVQHKVQLVVERENYGAERRRTVEQARRIAELDRELDRRSAVIAEQQQSLAAKDKTISLLTAEVKRAKTWKRSLGRVFGVKK